VFYKRARVIVPIIEENRRQNGSGCSAPAGPAGQNGQPLLILMLNRCIVMLPACNGLTIFAAETRSA
jgi:hypothetical protein